MIAVTGLETDLSTLSDLLCKAENWFQSTVVIKTDVGGPCPVCFNSLHIKFWHKFCLPVSCARYFLQLKGDSQRLAPQRIWLNQGSYLGWNHSHLGISGKGLPLCWDHGMPWVAPSNIWVLCFLQMDFVQAAGIQQGGMSLPVLVPRKRKLASKITCKTKLFRELVKTTILEQDPPNHKMVGGVCLHPPCLTSKDRVFVA